MNQQGSFGLPVLLSRATVLGAVLTTPLYACPSFAATPQIGERRALDELWLFLDRDGDGRVSRYEGAEAFLLLTDEADDDGDGALTAGEVRTFLREEREAEMEERIGGFITFDRNEDQELERHELPGELRGQFEAMDGDADGVVTLEELLAADELVLAVGDDLARFRVEGTRAFMTGVIGPGAPARVLELLLEHPGVDTLVLQDLPGSMDDESMLRAARMVRRAGLATHVPSGAEVASGGTDFFLAGVRRTAGAGARFGVHSWAGFGEQGADLPRDDPEHERYLDYYRAMGIPDAFYWFTLEAAPADSIHWMTLEELERFDMLTAPPVPRGEDEEVRSFEGMLELEGMSTVALLPLSDGRLLPSTAGAAVEWEADVRELWTELCSHLPGSTRSALAQVRAIRLIEGDDVPPGAAVPVGDPHGEWEILIARSALEDDDLFWVLTHEYGHVLSIGDAAIELAEDQPQLVPSGPRFGEFFERYWKQTGLFDVLRELNPEATTDPADEQRVVSYIRDESQLGQEFVSEFAMVSPEEDFTETFAAYVLRGVSSGSVPIENGGREKLAWFASTYPRSAWVPDVPEGPDPIGMLDVSASADGIVPFPADTDPRIAEVFDRYAHVIAPNGKPIRIFAQSGWRRDQILRARSVLEHLLTDVPGSRFGANKAPVANAMAERRATLVLFDDEPALERAFSGPLGELELGFQDLRANECPVEGDPDYMAHETRDAAFEEILHLVHDYGIRPVHPEYDEALHRANLAMQEAGAWEGWPVEEPENHRNEYFAAIYDNYLDLWTVPPTRYEGEALTPDMLPPGTSHFGTYAHGSRAALARHDPQGHALIEDFLPAHLTYEALLPRDFSGEFSLRPDPASRYTAKSQHLAAVRALGDGPLELRGNDLDNELTCGAGDDLLEGRGGDDALAGGAGDDVAVYRGPRSDYAVVSEGGLLHVTDSVAARDGADRLRGVERLRFADGEVQVPAAR